MKKRTVFEKRINKIEVLVLEEHIDLIGMMNIHTFKCHSEIKHENGSVSHQRKFESYDELEAVNLYNTLKGETPLTREQLDKLEKVALEKFDIKIRIFYGSKEYNIIYKDEIFEGYKTKNEVRAFIDGLNFVTTIKAN